jgi:hypothetical protein
VNRRLRKALELIASHDAGIDRATARQIAREALEAGDEWEDDAWDD